MGPGDVAHVPPDPLAGGGGRSGCGALPLAGAASPLTCRAAPVNFSPFAALTTPKGLRSLRLASSLSFLVTCQRQVIPSHSFAALTALVVRRVNGLAALFMYRISGLAVLFVRCVNGVLALLHAAPMVIQPYPSTRFRGFCAAKTSKPYPAPAPCRSGGPGAKRSGPPEAGGRSGKSG